MEPIIRIKKITLSNFKNTYAGTITMPSFEKENPFKYSADILGIYGQNGTGKTAIVEALDFMQRLFQGQALPDDTQNYISADKDSFTIQNVFTVEIENTKAEITYGVCVEKKENTFIIQSEELLLRLWDGETFGEQQTLFAFSSKNPAQFTPKSRYEQFAATDDIKLRIGIDLGIAQREKKSAIFNKASYAFFINSFAKENRLYAEIINTLLKYVAISLTVITNKHTGAINLNFGIPLSFIEVQENTTSTGTYLFDLRSSPFLRDNEYKLINAIIHTINSVLFCIIPNLSLELKCLNKEIDKNGIQGHRVQLLSKRGTLSIPVQYESAGIIKLISILNTFIYTYNNASACFVIDELDAGIFEHLLGELLDVFQKSGKGQIVFTSHNLRPLEILPPENIVFSTTRPDNRYMSMDVEDSHHNLRDSYLRAIVLGGQTESLYMETDGVAIARAFRKAGREVLHASK